MAYKQTLKHFFYKKSDTTWHLSITKREVEKSARTTVLNEQFTQLSAW